MEFAWNTQKNKMNDVKGKEMEQDRKGGLMSIFWTQKVKLFYAALLANNSHCSGVM